MQWINYLLTFNIPFYIYKLKTNDTIIEYKDNQKEKSIIIIHGAIYLTHMFTNQETLPLAILGKNNIIDTTKYSINNKSYYKIKALKQTYLICFFNKYINNNREISKHFLKYYIMNYQITLTNYKMMNHILIQKNTQYRMIQLMILLSIKFGIITEKHIKIPLKIRKQDIAVMIGSNYSTIHKVFKLLKLIKIITYSKNNFIYINNYSLLKFIYLLN